ncbi:MAG: formylglycine-generating enzyme family protein [Bryobacteraceae bacterium]
MALLTYSWIESAGPIRHAIDFALVGGTRGNRYPFGDRAGGGGGPLIEIPRAFYIGVAPVTQALWVHVMGSSNPALNRESGEHPLENVSWDSLTATGGFLDRINAGSIRAGLAAGAALSDGALPRFRLPTEAQWEYAARGGPHWRDGYMFSGGDDIDAVAWYDRRHGDHTQPVRRKAPNQLGIYDMSGNVWEWCRDVYNPDPARVPADGSAFAGPDGQRVLRGGCFHNWAIHCTVSKRYEIDSDAHDGCIGFRLVFD